MIGPALPPAAVGPDIPTGGVHREEVGPGVHYLTDGVYQSAFLVTGAGVVVVDAPPVLGGHLLAGIAEVTDRPVTHLIYTHSHTDHIGAAHLLPADAQRTAHSAVGAKLTTRSDARRPTPTVTFDRRHRLDVGGVAVELDYPGPNHEVGNIFVAVPASRVLVAVDIVFPGWVPFGKVAHSDDIPGWLAAHDRLLERDDWDVLVTGHLGRVGTREDVEVGREYGRDLLRAARRAFAEVSPAAVTTDGADAWGSTSAWFDALTDHVVDRTAPTWRHRLAGFSYHRDNAYGFVEAVAVEFPER